MIMIEIQVRPAEKLTGESQSLFITFPYNKELVDLIKTFPYRWWHQEMKEWELPYSQLTLLKNRFDIFGEAYQVFEDQYKEQNTEYKYAFKTPPFTHQKRGFEYGMEHKKWLLGDEQGLGKTKQVIDIAVAKKEKLGYKHCLIICGVNGLKWNWVNEIHTHSNEGAYILGQRVDRTGKIIIPSNSHKKDDLSGITENPNYFIITNVESLRNDEIVEKLIDLCKQGEISMIAADEVHKMKNPSSQQGKGFLKLKADTMIAMTGTPLINSPMDLYIILKWLGYEQHSFYSFKNHYCVLGGYGDHEIIGYKNLNELEDKLDLIMLRRLKTEVLDLPDKLYVDEYVEMTSKQEQIYKEVTMNIKAHIDEIKMSPNPLAELIRMRQATGYTGILSSTIQESAKLDRMEELVEEAVSNGKKVVIFSNWTSMTDEIFNRLAPKGYSTSVITGNTKDELRQHIVDSFQNDERCKVIVGTIGAMGTGLTLTAGTIVIFMDEPWSKALKVQAEDRCHRVGTSENITIYTIMCKNTIDERIHDIVEQKGIMADTIVDGRIIGNKVELLNYLIQ